MRREGESPSPYSTKQGGAHTCDIVGKGVDHYKVYRYDLDECDFLPFFNKDHDDAATGYASPNPTPSGLRKFCDYILLAAVGDKLYVILVEMKSGNTVGAHQQLDASETFIDYVKASADRIKTFCGYDEFDTKNIVLRKVLLKPAPKFRPATNIGRRNTQIDWGADPVELIDFMFKEKDIFNKHLTKVVYCFMFIITLILMTRTAVALRVNNLPFNIFSCVISSYISYVIIKGLQMFDQITWPGTKQIKSFLLFCGKNSLAFLCIHDVEIHYHWLSLDANLIGIEFLLRTCYILLIIKAFSYIPLTKKIFRIQ